MGNQMSNESENETVREMLASPEGRDRLTAMFQETIDEMVAEGILAPVGDDGEYTATDKFQPSPETAALLKPKETDNTSEEE